MNNFIIIPERLLKEKISSSSILLFGILFSRSKKLGYAYTTNKHLTNTLNCSIRTISNLIRELNDLGFIRVSDGKSAKRKIYVSYNFPS